jgi:hypothetical protein
MKYLMYIFMATVLNITVSAQSNLSAESELAKASLYHLQKDYAKAIQSYETAFKAKEPDASNAYKAAGVYSLSRNAERSEYYLQLALDKGWTESLWLMIDPYFDYIKHSDPLKWSTLVAQAAKKETEYEKKLKNPALRRKINLMVISDQQLRYKKIQAKDPKELEKIDQEIRESDQKNWLEAKNIVGTHGWPKLSDIGKDGQNNLWLIVQHADHDICFQRTVLEKMKPLLKSNEVNVENYAFLTDRVLCNLNYLQEYGTQVNWTTNGMASSFRDIRQEWNVNEKRKKLGLPSLETYALSYGFNYKAPTKQDYKRARKQIETKVKSLIDTALVAYNAGDFQSTYDNYNSASVFADGMNDHQSLEAAKVFSTIATKIEDNQNYMGISFDFLNLLNLRKKLNKASIKEIKEFEILHPDPRWMLLLQSECNK